MKISFLYIALILFSLSACKKYLDKKSDNAMVVPTSLADLQGLLDDADNINNNRTSNYGEVSADDYFVTDIVYNSQIEYERDAYRWKPFDYVMYNDWSQAYLPIYTANLCLEGLEKITKTSQNQGLWNNIKGSALFLRSYYFLNLAWTFSKAFDQSSAQADLGVVLRMTSDFNTVSVRASSKETYERIINDSKEAITYLPDNPSHVYRPSKAAAYGVLSRAYLSMRQYDSAGKYANLCLLLKNDLLDYSSEINTSSYNPFPRFNKETIFYSEISQSFLFINYNWSAFVDTILYGLYTNSDLRKAAFFSESGGYYSFKGMYTSSYTFFSGIATDEMYLIRSECHARAGNKEAALEDLNHLLEKRFMAPFVPVTAGTSQEALNRILVERRKELLMRGLRWMDIKRLNKEGANIIPKRLIAGQEYTLPPNDKRYALPLPKDIIDMTGIPQN